METRINILKSSLYFVGDIHGEFGNLGFKIAEAGIEDAAFIILGDCGLGFNSPGWLDDVYRRKLKTRIEDKGNHLYLFRGNHDNPEIFQDPPATPPAITILPDYSRLTWGTREILVIGGGISVDKEWRLKEEEKTRKKIWWADEGIVQDLSRLKGKEDIIVSHMAPLCIGPVLTRGENIPHEIWASDKSNREYLSAVLKQTNPSRWYFGHYHSTTSGNYGDCIWRGLDINEILELR